MHGLSFYILYHFLTVNSKRDADEWIRTGVFWGRCWPLSQLYSIWCFIWRVLRIDPPPIVCSQILTLVNCFWCFNFDIDIFYVYSDFLSGLWLLLRYRLILLRYIRILLQFLSFLRWHWCSFTSTLSFLRQPQRFSYLDLDFFLPRFRLFLT